MRKDRRDAPTPRLYVRRNPRGEFTREDFDSAIGTYIAANTRLGTSPVAREYPIYCIITSVLAEFAPNIKIADDLAMGAGENPESFHHWLGRRGERAWKPKKKK